MSNGVSGFIMPSQAIYCRPCLAKRPHAEWYYIIPEAEARAMLCSKCGVHLVPKT